MNDAPTKLEARLCAIEFLVANLYGIENRRRGWDADRILNEHTELLDRMRQRETRTLPAHDPASRDVYQAIERLLADIRALS
jgi:hypothetical protein